MGKNNKYISGIIILVGLPGSGKSYFAEKLKNSNPEYWKIISQDTMGSRKKCEDEYVSAIKKNKGVILDRCNVEKSDRKYWINLAFKSKNIVAIHFDFDKNICIDRVKNRVGHPTIKYGRGENIVKSFHNKFQKPTDDESFKKIITLSNKKEVYDLLIKMGCKESDLCDDTSLIKFPRTPILFNYDKEYRDDIVLQNIGEFVGKHAHEVIVEEKVDGANIGISIDKDYNVILQNRSHYITCNYSEQFKSINNWVNKMLGDLYTILKSPRYILYGEWLYAKHSIHYDNLKDYFMAFDIFDKFENKFLSREKFIERLEGTNIIPVRTIMKAHFSTKEQIINLLSTPSSFYDGPIEGVYLRIDNIDKDGYLHKRAKLVRSDFIQTNEFWTAGGIVKNKIML